MGAMSRRKGQRGEREAAEALRAIGIEAHRTGQTCGLDSPDVQTALPGVWMEVKRTERLNLRAAMEQAARDGGISRLPVVLHRSNRQPWLCTARLADLPALAAAVVHARQTPNPIAPQRQPMQSALDRTTPIGE